MDKNYNSCSYKARRKFLDEEFVVYLFDVDDAGISVVALQIVQDHAQPFKLSRVFSRAELEMAGITNTLEGHVSFMDSLELVEDTYFTRDEAVRAGQNVLTAYQLSSSLPGISSPPPIVSLQAAQAYFSRAPVGPKTNSKSKKSDEKLLITLVAKGLAELCREKPLGLEGVRWLGNWFLEHNPAKPKVEIED